MAREAKREPFDRLYVQLEERVGRLEQGGLSLEEAIALYEEGMAFARSCQERLDEAEQKIMKLKESFAALPQHPNGALRDQPEDYEYVAEEASFEDGDDLT